MGTIMNHDDIAAIGGGSAVITQAKMQGEFNT
jgi:hypothetical protein